MTPSSQFSPHLPWDNCGHMEQLGFASLLTAEQTSLVGGGKSYDLTSSRAQQPQGNQRGDYGFWLPVNGKISWDGKDKLVHKRMGSRWSLLV